jgi:hypothetical protein
VAHRDHRLRREELTTEDAEDTEKTKEAGESEDIIVSPPLLFVSLLCVLRVLCGSNLFFLKQQNPCLAVPPYSWFGTKYRQISSGIVQR